MYTGKQAHGSQTAAGAVREPGCDEWPEDWSFKKRRGEPPQCSASKCMATQTRTAQKQQAQRCSELVKANAFTRNEIQMEYQQWSC